MSLRKPLLRTTLRNKPIYEVKVLKYISLINVCLVNLQVYVFFNESPGIANWHVKVKPDTFSMHLYHTNIPSSVNYAGPAGTGSAQEEHNCDQEDRIKPQITTTVQQ